MVRRKHHHEWNATLPTTYARKIPQHCCKGHEMESTDPSIGKTMASGSVSVNPCNGSATLSQPALVESANRNVAVATFTDSTNCLTMVLPTNRSNHVANDDASDSARFLFAMLSTSPGEWGWWCWTAWLFANREEQVPIMESNDGRWRSLFMLESLPAESRLDDRNIRKKRHPIQSLLAPKFVNLHGWVGAGHWTVERGFATLEGWHYIQVPSQRPRKLPDWRQVPQPEQEPTPSRHGSPPHQLASCDVDDTRMMLLRKILIQSRWDQRRENLSTHDINSLLTISPWWNLKRSMRGANINNFHPLWPLGSSALTASLKTILNCSEWVTENFGNALQNTPSVLEIRIINPDNARSATASLIWMHVPVLKILDSEPLEEWVS